MLPLRIAAQQVCAAGSDIILADPSRINSQRRLVSPPANRCRSSGNHLAPDPDIINHGLNLAFVLRIHDDYEIRRALQQALWTDNSLSHKRHKMVLFSGFISTTQSMPAPTVI